MSTAPTLASAPPAENGAGIESLRDIPLLAGLSDEELERLRRAARRLSVPAGARVMREGSVSDGLYLLLDGELEVTRRDGEREVVLEVYGPGVFLGEMSLVGQVPRTASVSSLQESELLVIDPAEFHRLLRTSPAASQAVLRAMLERLRSTEATLVQNAKLASLGTLAAGLAHELNNPAAALRRGLPQLRGILEELERCAQQIGGLGLPQQVAARLEALGPADSAANGGRASAVEVNLAEDRLLDWLEERGIAQAVALAPPLAAVGWTPERLQALLAGSDGPQAGPVLRWLAARCAADALIEELTRGAAAISETVAAVRAHSALGQAEVGEYDVVRGLEAALTILRPRLREGIRVVRDYAAELPRVEAYGAELNHLWTNLLHNALDAMQGAGTLEVSARSYRDGIEVQVTDSGCGIPADLQPRIFDPFFTTKPLGSGTGLGLHVAYNLVRRHRGSIEVDSRPGRTTFTVVLPLRLRGEG